MILVRLLAVLTLLVFSGQALLPALHHAVAPHEVCAEHGELVHSGRLDAHGPAAEEASSSSAREDGPQVATNAAEHAHDHCGHCAALRWAHAALFGDATLRLQPVAERATLLCLHDVFRPDGLGLHRLAPKQGPPGLG